MRIAIAMRAAVDSVELTVTAAGGDRETLVLAETAVDSGASRATSRRARPPRPSATACSRSSATASSRRSYVDPLDATDRRRAAALVDPFGLVFDSQTGGAGQRRARAARRRRQRRAGRRARRRRRQPLPAEMITGQAVTDAGGTVYAFPPGVFRFPLVAPGDYRHRRRAARPLPRAVDRARSAPADATGRAVRAAARLVRRRRSRSRARSRRPIDIPLDPPRAAVHRQEHGARRRRDRRLRPVHRDGPQHDGDVAR